MNAKIERARLRACIAVGGHLAKMLDSAGRAMETLLDGTGFTGWRGPDPGVSPGTSELAAGDAADALDRTARRALELHRVGDGPAQAEFARQCQRYAEALRVAASGRWPDGVEEIQAALHKALRDSQTDARLTAKGALRAHALDAEQIRIAGPAGATLAGRIEHETRHELAELHKIASAPATATLF